MPPKRKAALPASQPDSTIPPKSLLLELPSELRNRIFELLVILFNGWGNTTTVDVRRYQRITPRLRIAQVNRQLRSEVLPVFYGMNLFRFVSTRFLCIENSLPTEGGGRMLGPRSRTMVKRVTTIVPESSLVCFGFTEPNPEKGASRVEDRRLGNFIELPTFSLRKLIKRVELVLEVPDDCENAEMLHREKGAKPRYTQPQRDWLYPLRNMHVLGFGKLTALKVVINHGKDIEIASTPRLNRDGDKERLEEWVNGQIAAMSLEDVAETVQVEYAKVEPPPLPPKRR
ncbi:hypothetical protein LTR27_005677 [Elasticomyces elasticus]|nr:hypothetical protein LTR27_005677 [Elasticomyces elasticus]